MATVECAGQSVANETDQCSLTIRHRLDTMPNTSHYTEYRRWAAGDTILDWHGAESAQLGAGAAGSPMVWTTSDASNTQAYHPLNRCLTRCHQTTHRLAPFTISPSTCMPDSQWVVLKLSVKLDFTRHT